MFDIVVIWDVDNSCGDWEFIVLVFVIGSDL